MRQAPLGGEACRERSGDFPVTKDRFPAKYPTPLLAGWTATARLVWKVTSCPYLQGVPEKTHFQNARASSGQKPSVVIMIGISECARGSVGPFLSRGRSVAFWKCVFSGTPCSFSFCSVKPLCKKQFSVVIAHPKLQFCFQSVKSIDWRQYAHVTWSYKTILYHRYSLHTTV